MNTAMNEGLLPQKAAIGENEIAGAIETLQRYKNGKANLENRIVENELWWRLRHWETVRKGLLNREKPGAAPEPTSAWLFNAIINKHADAMDNYPEPVVLPREQSDEQSAKTLSEVLPVVLENNDFEQTYSDNWTEKLKHGTAAYGVFWNADKENGLGDVDVRAIDLLKLFWEPGIDDIQQSRNLFIVDLVPVDSLKAQYPELREKLGGSSLEVKQYVYDENIDVSDKSVVVDWYYKVRGEDGRTRLHFAKFVGDTLLYASENDPEYAGRGFYDHGLYPVVLDALFPVKGMPTGFGYVDICKDPQLYIDKLSANILENAIANTKPRYFVGAGSKVNKDQFLDWNEATVEVQGVIDETHIKEITARPLDSIYVTVLQQKIEEMKDTAANRDVNSGGTGGGVTAASAIAALQEAGNKVSRDMISASYRAYVKVSRLCLELIRQFYTEERSFRITAPNGGNEFVSLSNAGLIDQPVGMDSSGGVLYRRPVFDLKIYAQKKNPFSRMEQNETAKELYKLGFFNPDRAQEALICLDMMEFEGAEKIRKQVREGQTLLKAVQQLMQENQQLKAALGMAAGGLNLPQDGVNNPAVANGGTGGVTGVATAVLRSREPQQGYVQNLVKRSAAR